jgi:hypothetical protein
MGEAPKNGDGTACESRLPAGSSEELKRRKGDYYYDDAHGYETYIPDEDDIQSDKKAGSQKSRPGNK